MDIFHKIFFKRNHHYSAVETNLAVLEHFLYIKITEVPWNLEFIVLGEILGKWMEKKWKQP